MLTHFLGQYLFYASPICTYQMDLFANDIPFAQTNLKKVQCRWHRFSPSAFPQDRLLSLPTLDYQKYKPYRLGSPHNHSPTR